jgi:hypothetical protein
MASRDERIETYYHESAWDLAEKVVDLEDEIGADVDGICTGMHADVAEAHDAWEGACRERDRFESAWKSARRRAKWARRYADSDLRFTRNMWSDALRDLNRYRLAWLSARRRAADEANFGMEALDRERARQASFVAELRPTLRARMDELRRHRAFADEVKQVHYSCRDGEPDCAERFLKRVYDSMYELWDAEREKRPFVASVQRRAARGEVDDVTEDESRETTDAPRLEQVGTEDDGGTVWRLASGRRIR